MVRRGLARSRAHAAELISSGVVKVGGLATPKPATLVDQGRAIDLAGEPARYVSRGGLKLEGALRDFPVEVVGRRALDVGASTGGFSDYLLQHDVGSVVAVDVGYGQLDAKISSDQRVEVLDRTNVRHLTLAEVGARFELIVGDLSFISLCTVAPALSALASEHADLVMLVKPQFEVGKGNVGKGGIVSDPELWRAAIEKVIGCFNENDLGVRAVTHSPIAGAKGNKEFFVWAIKGAAPAEVEVPL